MDTKNITMKYIFDKNYNPQYANGAYGGIGPQGELILNFYFERMPMPYDVEYELTETGKLGNVNKTIPEDFNSTVIRYITAGVVLNKSAAINIRDWLNGLIDQTEVLKNERCDSDIK